ncbi:MAG: hypothetical protein FJ388_07890, partial [Verrucomicrobia bacterium]|nr:hypothetical protein [Verrucomicrobiota bacterium]
MNGASFALLKIPAVIVPGVTGARWSQKLAELARRPHECVRSETDMEVLHTPPAQAQMREESGRLFSVAQFTTDRFIFQEREQIRQQLVSDIRDAKSREAVLADFDRTIAEFKNSKDTLEAALTQTTMLEGSLSDFEKELEAACLERLCPLSRAIRVEIVCFWTLDRMHEITSQFERALTLLRE